MQNPSAATDGEPPSFKKGAKDGPPAAAGAGPQALKRGSFLGTGYWHEWNSRPSRLGLLSCFVLAACFGGAGLRPGLDSRGGCLHMVRAWMSEKARAAHRWRT